MAAAFPNSRFFGFDYHVPSIERARRTTAETGVAGVTFEPAGAKDFPGHDYDFVTFFDCLHDMGDPVGAARHVRQALKEEGTVMLVEPFAGNRLEDNLTPVGRVYFGFSTSVCTPASLSQKVGLALGAQAGESAAARDHGGSRLHAVSPRDRYPIQFGVGSSPLTQRRRSDPAACVQG